MKKFIFLLTLLSINSAISMEVGEADQSIEMLTSIPEELIFKIIGHIIPEKITSPCQLIEFFKTLTALSKTNHQLRILIHDDFFLNSLAEMIAKRIEGYSMPAYKKMMSSKIAPIIRKKLLSRIQDNLILIYKLRNAITVSKDVKKAAALLKKFKFGAITTLHGDPLIIDVVSKGNTKMAELLLYYGADVNARKLDKNSRAVITPLIAAINAGNFEMVEFLLRNKADVNLGYKNSYPLFAAIRNYNLNNDILPVLLKYGADVEIKDKNGNTPLLATIENYLNSKNKDEWLYIFTIISLLRSKGANINAKNNEGDTAFIKAISSGNLGIVRLFLSRYKPDITIKNGWDANAIEVGRVYAALNRRADQNYKVYDDIVNVIEEWAKLHDIEL